MKGRTELGLGIWLKVRPQFNVKVLRFTARKLSDQKGSMSIQLNITCTCTQKNARHSQGLHFNLNKKISESNLHLKMMRGGCMSRGSGSP